MESRRRSPLKSTPLPHDYLKLVTEVFSANFAEGLKAFEKFQKGAKSRFEASGLILANEVLLCVSLHTDGQLSATSVYASADFDPAASAPSLQDLLNLCLDAAGGLFATLLDAESPEKLEQLADESLSALEDVPFDWTAVEVEKRKIYLKIDKANPGLDKLAEDWLQKNDPEHEERMRREQEETEKLFFTGPKKKSGSTLH